MFDQAANNYRRLGARNGIGMSRNVTYFGILVGLMLLVSSFYLYISSSNDAAALRTELRQQADLTARLKTELLQANAQIEELKVAESACTKAKTSVDEQLEQCNSNAKSAKNNAETIMNDKEALNTELSALKATNTKLQATINAQTANMSAFATVNETIDTLRRDIILKDEIIRKLENTQPAAAALMPRKEVLATSNTQKADADAAPADAGEDEPQANVAAPPPLLEAQAALVASSTTTSTPKTAVGVDDQAELLLKEGQQADHKKSVETDKRKNYDAPLNEAAAVAKDQQDGELN